MFIRYLRLSSLVLALITVNAASADPIVIAHRGASGYLPEHTLEAYAVAHAMGADFVEPDLVLTKGGVFICLHDIHLEATTTVEEVYPDRHREDGHWYAIDFTVEEIKGLQAHERLPNRFPFGNSNFQVPTFAEMVELIQGLNATTDRDVGIYPELKGPAFHAKEGQPVERKLLETLARYGYKGPDAKVFVQCFEIEPLKKIRHELKSDLPLIMLIGGGPSAKRLLSEDGLDEVAEFANGIGPSKGLIEANPDIVKWAHKRNLKVHPYTFRADQFSKKKYGTFENELKQFFDTYKVDGLFTDFPDKVAAYLSK